MKKRSVLRRLGLIGTGAMVATMAPVALAGTASAATAAIGQLDASQASSLAAGATSPVIVLFKNQASQLPDTPAQAPSRASAVAGIQAPVVNELHQLNAPDLHTYSVLNAVSAKVSPAEEARLAADPDVASVVPDQTAQLDFTPPTGAASATPTAAASPSATAPSPTAACQPGSDGVELDPQALEAIHANSNLPGDGPTASSLGITGAGVKVAFFAEGFQTGQPNFTRPNGQPAVTANVDFTGEGTGTFSGGEASLDASSLVAQGTVKYQVKLPSGATCTFRVLGAAPGASAISLKVFSNSYLATTDSILQAIDYAVSTAHVNILSQSFGYNPLPDTMTDVIRQADEAAVAAGTVVDVSTGDGGPTSTQGSPSTDPAVIAAGASTTYRIYAQQQITPTGVSFNGWEDDNLSSLSSAGSTEGLKGPNVIAPGDLNWVTCNPTAGSYGACVSGGTSEAAPLTSAVAALVIQAYEKTHGGATPTPALVKQIITSTTTDLGLPADQQGSGLLNAYQAVLAAESVKTSAGAPAPTGTNLLTSTNDITATAPASTAVSQPVSLTNTGTATESVSLQGRVLSDPKVISSASIPASGATTTKGVVTLQKTLTFTVAPGTSYLAAHAATTSTDVGSSVLDVDLIDPLGRLAVDGLPQGQVLTSNVGVRYPDTGTWKAIVTYSSTVIPSAPIAFDATTQQWQAFGTASPSQLTLAPGQTGSSTITVTTPATAGDLSAALQITPSFGQQTSIPIELRSLIGLSKQGTGSFTAPVTGGNGRAGTPGTTKYFALDVPSGAPELNVQTSFTNGPATDYTLLLISPSGEALGHASNQLMVGGTTSDPVTTTETGAASHVLDPAAGQWIIIVSFANPTSGTAVQSTLAGQVDLSQVPVTTSGVPSAASYAIGSSHVVAVTVTNSTDAPQAYFLDPRTSSTVTRTLKAYDSSSTVTLPLAMTASIPQYIVPTDTTSLLGQVDATAPVSFDMSPYTGNSQGELNGDPQITAQSTGDSATASYSDQPVTPGDWNVDPALVGTYTTTTGAAPTAAQVTLQATTLGFNPQISTTYGDLWKGDTSLHPVIVQPGASTTLYAVVAPTKKGTTSGTIYLDTESSMSPFGNAIPAGDQVAAIPYSYTTAPAAS